MPLAEKVFEVCPFASYSPLPSGIRIGSVLYVPCLEGRDPLTGTLADGFEAQARQALASLRAVLADGGVSLSNVAHVTFFLQDVALRPRLNVVWEEVFPDPHDRPTHIYVPGALLDGEYVRVQVFAIADGKREVLEIPGMVHQDPMSMGVKVDGAIFSSRIFAGTPQGTPLETQVAQVFKNVDTLLQQAGASVSNLTQVTAFITDASLRPLVDQHWRGMSAGLEAQPHLNVVEWGQPGVRVEITGAL